jgi:hypothetical protein
MPYDRRPKDDSLRNLRKWASGISQDPASATPEEDENPLKKLARAVKARFGASTDEERAASGKEAAEGAAALLPDALMPHGALDAAKKRRKQLEDLARE